jgi:AAA15 family ATPase/GTPase
LQKSSTLVKTKLLELSISNIGPIRQLILKPRLNSDGRPIPIALVGKNGSGKSLTLGALLDAITELRRKAFREIPETDTTSYIRISSKNYISENSRTFSKVNVKLGGEPGEAVFSEVVSILPFSDLEKASPEITAEIISKNPEFKDSGFFKNIDVSDNQLQGARELLFLYFPYFRYEPSAWMSDKVNTEFAKTPFHYGISRLNPIRTNIIQETRGWILNALLDREIYERKTFPLQVHENLIVQVLSEYSGPNSMLISLINELLYEMLNAKDPSVTSARLGISQRTNREIAVLHTKGGIERVAAFDIDQLSSGELMTIGLATEIIRGQELARGNIPNSLEEIDGIVLVDEIDLHLHLEYQKTVLPRILRRFPLVQFIMTTHSPLFICGMAETGELDVINLPSGRQISPEEFGEFNLCYKFFVDANNRFKQGLDELRQRVAAHGKPLIITEGHLENSVFALGKPEHKKPHKGGFARVFE